VFAGVLQIPVAFYEVWTKILADILAASFP
jgi:hypothetical protein